MEMYIYIYIYKKKKRRNNGEGTNVQGQVQAQHVALLQQGVETAVLGASQLPLGVLAQPCPVVIQDPHTEGHGFLGHVAAYAAHADDAQAFALRVVAQCGQRPVLLAASPAALREVVDAQGEVPQGPEHEEDGGVGRGVVHSRGHIGHLDAAAGAGWDVLQRHAGCQSVSSPRFCVSSTGDVGVVWRHTI